MYKLLLQSGGHGDLPAPGPGLHGGLEHGPVGGEALVSPALGHDPPQPGPVLLSAILQSGQGGRDFH